MKESGSKIKCMDKVSTRGKMVEDMRDSMSSTKNKDLVNTNGLMVECIVVNGLMESSTDKE